VLRHAAIVGASGCIGGYTLMNDWFAPGLSGTKAHDFAISLGPVVVTPDEVEASKVEWDVLVARAARNTRLLPGDVIAAPPAIRGEPVSAGVVELELAPFGVLRNYVVSA
jgi:hypothetical protein